MHQMPSRAAEPQPRENPLIVIVDDDDLIRKSTGRLLGSIGFRFETFASAEEFIESTAAEEAACLLLDVKMPGMGGLELKRFLAARGFRCPIIFVTANGNEENERQALLSGAAGFLHKPVPKETLLGAIRNALGAA